MHLAYLSGGCFLFAMTVAVIFTLIGKMSKHGRVSGSYKWKKPEPTPIPIPPHEGLTTETYEIFVLDPEKADESHRNPVGTELRLSYDGNYVSLPYCGKEYCLGIFQEGSQLESVLAENKPYYVYIKERYPYSIDTQDIFTIIVYY
ncbi:MAG: hypothetical protein K2M04_00855 [Muribaculaceae bacterium]|nr:hypothetical protein [Muribaculaceae bacterium]